MSDLVELMEFFNRKERFLLIRQALGTFRLIDDFRTKLGRAIDLTIPQAAFIAIDYHLDWLAAALHAHKSRSPNGIFENANQEVVGGNQQDIDLLIAFDEGEKSHVVLVEAKGATGWSNSQMQSKAKRLRQIFGSDGECYPGVVPHFCLLSPRPPQHLQASDGLCGCVKEMGHTSGPYWKSGRIGSKSPDAMPMVKLQRPGITFV